MCQLKLYNFSSTVVLYGGGVAGQNFYRQIQYTKFCNVAAVLDKNFADVNIRDIPVLPPSKVTELSYDTIVITILDKKYHEEIRNDLIKYGVPENKIVAGTSPSIEWTDPDVGFRTQPDIYEAKKLIDGYLKEIDPRLLVTKRRMDVAIRYLLFRDFVYDIDNPAHLSLFSRYTFTRTGGKEVKTFHSGDGKKSVQEFIDKGRQMCRDMKTNGFDRHRFIPLGYKGIAFDGLHRIAAALAAGEKVWTHQYENVEREHLILPCEWNWFEENGFSFEDKLRIMRGFTDIYPGKCGMFVLFSPAISLWEYIEKQIASQFTYVGKIDYDFSDNYIAYQNIIRQIYYDYGASNELISRKLDMLMLSPLKFRIIVFNDEECVNSDFYGESRNLKLSMREALKFDIDPHIPLTMHGTDTSEEFIHLKNILLSANNIYWEKRRFKQYYRGWFFEISGKIKKWCSENNVPLTDVCLVGSAPLELYGIRDAKDLDFVVGSKFNYLPNKIKNDNYDIRDMFWFIDESGRCLPNEAIVYDDEYYTVFNDIKFCNMQFVKRRKLRNDRAKDRIDVARIDAFNEMMNYQSEKQMLRRQITLEMKKRGLLFENSI